MTVAEEVKPEKKVEKKQKSPKKGDKLKAPKKALDYFIESKEELKKVSWPSRKQTLNYTILVLIISAVVAGFLGLFDFVLTSGLNALLKK